MRHWWGNLAFPEKGGETQQKTADDPAECASRYRLEPLEPRLLLSADPISAELARVVQAEAQQLNDDAVAAIIQQADAIAESDTAAVSGDQQGNHKVNWPAGWSSAADRTENFRIDLKAVMAELIYGAVDALMAGTDAGELTVRVSAASTGVAETGSSAAETAVSGESEPDQNVDEAVVNDVLREVIQGIAAAPQAKLLADLNVVLADLEGDLVAEISGDTLFVDIDAAGNGWFVDPASVSQFKIEAAGEIQASAVPANAASGPVFSVNDPFANSVSTDAGDAQTGPVAESSRANNAQIQPDQGEAGATSEHSGNAADNMQKADFDQLSNLSDSGAGNSEGASGGAETGELQQNDAVYAASNDDTGDAAEQVVAYVATTLRAAEYNRSNRSDNNRLNGKNAKQNGDDASQTSPLPDSNISTSVDKGNESDPRAPPENQELAINFSDDFSDYTSDGALVLSENEPQTAHSDAEGGSLQVSAGADDTASDTLLSDDGQPRAPPTEDSLPRGPPATNDSGLANLTLVDYLQAEGTPSAAGVNLTTTNLLTDDLLVPSTFVDNAITLWTDSGLFPFGGDLLSLSVVVADLSTTASDLLAFFAGSTITIDDDAAGFGWFIDSTPLDNSEFDGSMAAPAGIDLLTVLLHEMGHALGFAHDGELGLQGVEVMSDTLGEGVRLSLQMVDGTNLNDVIDVILATFDRSSPPADQPQFSNSDASVSNVVTVGSTVHGGVDLSLEGVSLTFSSLSYGTSWDGEVLVEAALGILLPGRLDIVIVDDDFGSPIIVESASAPSDAGGGNYTVTFTVKGDHTDLEAGDVVGVLNSNEAGFDDTDPVDANTIIVSSSTYVEGSDETTIVVTYNFDPGSATWTGGSVIAVYDKVTGEDDNDIVAVFGTIKLADGDNTSLLNLDELKAADLGWPTWLNIKITDLKLEFADFRVDDSNSSLKLDADFLGFDTGNPAVNAAIKALLNVEGSASGVVFNIDVLADAQRVDGVVEILNSPIADLSGISGRVVGNLPGIGKLGAGFIVKSVGIDASGAATDITALTVKTVTYAAVTGLVKFGGTQPEGPAGPDGKKPDKVGGLDFGINFAVSELGPLQFFLYTDAKILVDPQSGLTITQLRGGIRFNATIEDLQVRPPFTATDGSAIASGDLENPVEITLSLPGHNLKIGDEFRIVGAGDLDLLSGSENFVVADADEDAITYLTGGNGTESDPANYTFGGTIEVKKISISDPFDLRDPGFKSTKNLTLATWEAQLDNQVVQQAAAGDNVWQRLFDKVVIEAGATLDFAPRIRSELVSFDVDLLLDSEFKFLITGSMTLATAVTIPAKLFADLSQIPSGSLTILFLADLPEIPASAGIEPLVVAYAGVTFETLIAGVPATLDALSGFPVGIGTNITNVTISDVAAGGPWKVTVTLDSDAATVASEYSVGDTLAIVGSDPDSFNGNYLVTDVNGSTVSFVIGNVVIDGQVDVNRDGVIDSGDAGVLGTIPIIAGILDMNKDGVVDVNDVGEVFNVVIDPVTGRQVIAYAVIGGYIDVDGDDVVNPDTDDDVVLGEDPRSWNDGFDRTRDIVDGMVDIDGDGVIGETDDFGLLGGIVVVDGRLDFDRSGVVDAADTGTFLNVVIDSNGNRQVTPYQVISGYLDISGDGLVFGDASYSAGSDNLVLATASDLGGYWIEDGFKAANQDDLGDGLRISIVGGVDLNIPTVTTLSLSGSATLDLIFGGAEDVRIEFAFDMALTETNIGTIGQADGKFFITMDAGLTDDVDGVTIPRVEIWGAAIITTDFGFLEELGLYADASGVLVFNNTNSDKAPIELMAVVEDPEDPTKTIIVTATVVPTAQTFALRLDGSIAFRIDFDGNSSFAETEQVFLLEGIFVLSFSAEQGFNVALFSESGGVVGPAILKIGPGDDPLFEFTAFGFLAIRTGPVPGVAANIVIGLDAGVDGLNINGQFVFMMNTTGTDIQFVIPAGADDRAGGGSAPLTIHMPRAPPASLVEAGTDVFKLIAGDAWVVPANAIGAPYVLILLGGTDATNNPDASVTIGGFTIEGKFGFLASIDPVTLEIMLEMQFNARLELQPLNGALLVSGSLKISSAGVVGSLAIGGQLILSPLTIVGAFTLEVNTTDDIQTVQRYQFDFVTEQFKRNSAGDLVVQNSQLNPGTTALFAFAKLKFAGLVDLEGSVSFVNSPTLLSLDLDMSMQFFSVRLNVDGGARIVKTGTTGLVLKLDATLSANAFGEPGIFSFTAALELQINTRAAGPLDANDLGVARETFRIAVTNAELSLLSVITLTGSGFIEFTQGVLRMDATLSGNFLNLITVTASAFFSSEGEFEVIVDGSVQLGPDGFNITGSAHLEVSLLDSNGKLIQNDPSTPGDGNEVLRVSGSLKVQGTLFYIPLPEVIIGVAYNSSTGDITARVGPVPVPVIRWATVDLGWFGSIRVPYPWIELRYLSFTIGTLKLGPIPDPPVLGQVDGAGQLTLNVGTSANLRNLAGDQKDEGVIIEAAGAGSAPELQDIDITMFGVTKRFFDVKDIKIANMHDGNDSVNIADGVTVPIEVHFGSGSDSLNNLSAAPVTAYGDDGEDFLVGGRGIDRLFGGPGDDSLEGRLGPDQLDGGGDSDRIVWSVGDGSDSLINGQAGNDTLSITGTNSPEDFSINPSGGGFTVSIDGATLNVGGIEVADIEGLGGSDNFTINDLAGSGLSIIDLKLGDDNNGDTVIVNGIAGIEEFDVSAETVTISDVNTEYVDNLPVVTQVDILVDELQLLKTNVITINVFDANTTSGGDKVTLNTLGGEDTVNVRSVLAGVATEINGGIDSDIFNVGAQISPSGGSLNGIDALLTLNGNDPDSGSDVLNIDDSGDSSGKTGTLTATTISGLGMGGSIVYGTIEHLNISLGTGADTLNVLSTAVPTTMNTGFGTASNNINVGSLSPASNGNLNSINGRLIVNGQSSNDTLSVDDSGDNSSSGTLTGNRLIGLGLTPGDVNAGIAYTGVEALNISLGSGADVFDILSTSALTTVNTGGGATNNTVNVGSLAPLSGGNVNAIDGKLVVNGQSTGTDTVNIDDTGDASANSSTLSATRLTGLGMGGDLDTRGLQYSGIDALNINLGTGADLVEVHGTSALTTVNTGTVAPNTVNVGNPVDILNNVSGLLVINGQSGGSEILNVDDSGDPASLGNVGTLTDTRITGLGMAGGAPGKGIEYHGFDALNIDLGQGADVFTIESTHASPTTLDTEGGNDVINVQTTSGTLDIDSGTGSDTINVGSQAIGQQGDAEIRQNNTGGTVDGIGFALTIDGDTPDSGSDVLTVDDTGDSQINHGILTSSTISGLSPGLITYSAIEQLIISLGSGNDTFDILDTHGIATSLFQEKTTLNAGPGTDTINIDNVTDLLFVNGQADADTINVDGTGMGSISTLNGDGGNDIFNIQAMDGTVYVNGGADADTVNVGSKAPTLPLNGATTKQGTIDAINGLLDVNGGSESDVLNVDDSNPADINKLGTLTDMTIRDLALERGIDYSNLESLNIWLGFGDNTFNIISTHAGATTVNTAEGVDTVNIIDAGGDLTVNAEAGNDVVNVLGTGIIRPSNVVRIYGQEDDDTINLSDVAPALPADYPASLPPPVAGQVGNIDDINGLVKIYGGAAFDRINIDDSRNLSDKAGMLTDEAFSLTSLISVTNVEYDQAEDLNIWLGTGTDTFYIDSTHQGTTQLYAGDGNSTTNQRDDTIAIRSISGQTTVHGQAGNDSIFVNVFDQGSFGPVDGSDSLAVAANDASFARTHQNKIGAVLYLHGEGDSDDVTLNLAGEGNALINVHDNGAENDGVDTLTLNGADDPAAGANNDDTFLLRQDFVALLNDSIGDGDFDQFERVNYDQNINARLIVNGLDGNDRFVADDNSSITTLDGGEGNDSFQIGQIFATLRTVLAANIDPDDVFDTSRVIIGIIRDPTGNVVFDPSVDALTNAKILEIQSLIDPLSGFLAGIAYVSDGVSQPTTVYGGQGDDEFSVYQNKGTLRLEGEAGNDDFIVRAFVLLPEVDANNQVQEVEDQAETDVRGGADDDTIQYAINAPVSIDGGTGFDTVVVLGTPFPDAFVVNSEGIFGAGLNVTFDNVESAELDALEGDDTIYVLGTSGDLVTTVIGGQGNDTIEVMGDVVSDIVSNDLIGRAGLITHGFSVDSGVYANVGVNGVDASVVAADGGSLVDIGAAGIRSTLAENDGSVLQYLIKLTGTTAPGAAVHVTVSAGTVSTRDKALGGESILVSLDGVTWSKAVVLTFTEAGVAQSIFVRAVNDDLAEGPRLALISHSINSADPAYDDYALVDVLIDIVDDDQPGIDIRQFEEIAGVPVVDEITEVLEGVAGFSDIYTVKLTRAPGTLETVTVALSASAQVLYQDETGTPITELTFDLGNWDIPQLVRVLAVDDSAQDGTSLVTITHAITSDLAGDLGGLYDGIDPDAYPTLDVTVYDDESAGAIIRESDGRTIVVANAIVPFVADDDDSYRVRLTQAPVTPVTLELFTDRQTELVSDGRLVDAGTVNDTFKYELTFDANNWSTWYEVQVKANEDFTPTGATLKSFTPRDQNLDQIQGPLIIEGGVLEGRDRSFAAALLLPGETDLSVFQDNNSDQSGDIDRLDIFHTDSTGTESGKLISRNNPLDSNDANPWVALTGFETDRLGEVLTINEGTEDAPVYVNYGRGITFDGFEILEVLLGKGNETLDVEITPDNAITVVHGGGGDDLITITDRGSDAALVVYGDTSEQRDRYANGGAFPSASGTVFTNDGIDTIDASGMAEQSDDFVGVVIYGGLGDDTIIGSQDDDHIAGGAGTDTIAAEAGNDHVYGDSHFNLDPVLFAQDQVAEFDLATQLDLINAMFTVPTSGDGFDDVINGGSGNDVIFGDHGVIAQIDGTRRIEKTGSMVDLHTTNIANGGIDTIHGDAGNDFIFGGVAGDTIFGDLDSDLIFGDHGSVVVGDMVVDIQASQIGLPDGAGVQNSAAEFTYTSDTSTGADATAGNDTLYGGSLAVLDTDNGNNIILGQQGSDTIYGGGGDDDIYGGHNVENGSDTGDLIDGLAGNDVILGDNGLIERSASATDPRFTVLSGTTIYDANGDVQVGNSELNGTNPAVVEPRRIQLFDHDDSDTNNGFFGDDIIAGGADDDLIFGQLGKDVLHGDGKLLGEVLQALTATIDTKPSDVGGDDYIEGNGDSDTIYGGLGQDDLVGGNSSLYNLATASDRPDAGDEIYGGNGDLIARNNDGSGILDESGIGIDPVPGADPSHARDSDAIVGDNGNIYRLVKADGSAWNFNYDNYDTQKIVVRAIELLNYTPGGEEFDPAAVGDIGGNDTIRGESGDDSIYGMLGNDILFGGAQDDDIIGGYGHDWISGGTGQDGVLGDDGRIYTSRNSDVLGEPLYDIGTVTVNLEISTPGNFQQSTINLAGELKKSVNLTPFNVNPLTQGFDDPLYDAQNADDIIYGGLGGDFLHGGSGDDAISGAEALEEFYDEPENLGNVLGYGQVKAGEFAAYNEFNPWHKVFVDEDGVFDLDSITGMREFLLNFDVNEDDGNDRIFGDLGNDWLVGGTDRDHLYGGYGDDLLNADDNHDTSGGLNDAPDGPNASYEDIAYGGAGRDILIANTGGDRLIDWAGEFNSYIVPFAPFGLATISRAVQPQIFDYLLDLSESDGADATRAADTGNDPARNGEPDGELGMVIQKDDAWQDQTGAPADPQPGNIPGGARDVLRGADFNNGQAQGFAPDSGTWTIESGRLSVAPEKLGGEAVSVFLVDSMRPSYFEVEATINAAKPTAGWKSNAYLIFDYYSPTDFKFAGVNISTDKIEMGYRDASGWHVVVDTPSQLKPDRDYDLLLAINGTTVTLVVDDSEVFHHVYDPRVDADGWVYGINYGMVGIGANNAKGRIDNVKVQQLPPETQVVGSDNFSDQRGLSYIEESGGWMVTGGEYASGPAMGAGFATSFVDLGLANGLAAPSILELETRISTESISGFIFDRYEGSSYKFAAIDAAGDQLLIGHYTEKSGWVVDASFSAAITAGQDYRLELTLKGLTVSASLWQVDVPTPSMLATVGYVFNAVSVDGDFGLFSKDGTGIFDDVIVETDDPAFLQALVAATRADGSNGQVPVLSPADLTAIISSATDYWRSLGEDVSAIDDAAFEIVDLPGLLLGRVDGNTVYLDIDAAGHGWFVDSTPDESSEFGDAGADGVLIADSTSEAYGRMDLLTVAIHEIGHLLGLGHQDAGETTSMNESLNPGTRLGDTHADDGQVSLAESPRFVFPYLFSQALTGSYLLLGGSSWNPAAWMPSDNLDDDLVLFAFDPALNPASNRSPFAPQLDQYSP